MSRYAVEGGPFDGRRVDIDASIVRFPLPLPHNVRTFRDGPQMEIVEYRRVGSVYRHESLIADAWAEMKISEKLWRSEPPARREARRIIRRTIQDLDADKVIDRIVWVVARDTLRSMVTLAGFVGGRRAELAAAFREQIREPMGSNTRRIGQQTTIK